MASSVSIYLPDYGYTYRFSGVLSVKHEMSLNIQKDGESLYHTDYVNGARNEPNKVILEVLESDIGHAAGWATRMMQAMESIKRNRCVCVVTTPAFVYAGMLLSFIFTPTAGAYCVKVSVPCHPDWLVSSTVAVKSDSSIPA